MNDRQARTVLVEVRDHIMTLTLNRPDARNAVTAEMHAILGEALEEAEADPDIRVLILTGTGEAAFCAGGDLKAVTRGEDLRPQDPRQRAWGFAGIVCHPISKPIIAAVNGSAIGGGMELALACDLIVAANHAQFGLVEVKRGILAAAGGGFRIARQIPTKLAMELLLTGDVISAERAHAIGFVNQVVPRDSLMDSARALALRIAANAPLSVQSSKRLAMGIYEGHIANEEDYWQATYRELQMVMSSEDAREGTLAFTEKRAPVWKSR